MDDECGCEQCVVVDPAKFSGGDRLHFIQVRYQPDGENFTRELCVTLRDSKLAPTVRVAGLPNVKKVTIESYTVGKMYDERRVR